MIVLYWCLCVDSLSRTGQFTAIFLRGFALFVLGFGLFGNFLAHLIYSVLDLLCGGRVEGKVLGDSFQFSFRRRVVLTVGSLYP